MSIFWNSQIISFSNPRQPKLKLFNSTKCETNLRTYWCNDTLVVNIPFLIFKCDSIYIIADGVLLKLLFESFDCAMKCITPVGFHFTWMYIGRKTIGEGKAAKYTYIINVSFLLCCAPCVLVCMCDLMRESHACPQLYNIIIIYIYTHSWREATASNNTEGLTA
jgi:hypothetical protein